MKIPYFSDPDPGQRQIAVVRLVLALVMIAVSIPGMVLSRGNGIFAFLYFGGLILFFYALLYFWLRVKYYVVSILIHTALFFLFVYKGIGALVLMEKEGSLHIHGAEDIAWAIGSIFIAGIIGGIIGIVRSRLFQE